MQTIKIMAKAVSLASGVVELTRSQAQTREHALRHLEADLYEIVLPIQFKAGEVLGYSGEIAKGLMDSITTIKPKKGKKEEAD